MHGLRASELAGGQKGCPSGEVRAGMLVIWPAHCADGAYCDLGVWIWQGRAHL